MNYKESLKVIGGLLDAFDRDEHGDYFYEHGWEVCEAAILAYGALENQPFWISVEERLPERGTSVLCFSKDVSVFLGTDWVDWPNGNIMFRMGRTANWPYVTHWMPLPEPPEEVDDT